MLDITVEQVDYTIRFEPGYLSIRREKLEDGKVRYVFASIGGDEGIDEDKLPCEIDIVETETGERIKFTNAEYHQLSVPDGEYIQKYYSEATEPAEIIDQYLNTEPSWSAVDIE